MDEKKRNQCNKVLEYIEEHGGITQKEALDRLGVGRLSARVHDIRHRMGYPLITKTVCVKNREGSKCYVARYEMAKEDKQ